MKVPSNLRAGAQHLRAVVADLSVPLCNLKFSSWPSRDVPGLSLWERTSLQSLTNGINTWKKKVEGDGVGRRKQDEAEGVAELWHSVTASADPVRSSEARITSQSSLIWGWIWPEIKLPTSSGSSKKQESSRKNIYFCFIDYTKDFDYVDHNKMWKILQEMGIPDHLTCLLRNLYTGSRSNS